MKKYLTMMIILVLVASLAVGCTGTPSLTPTPSPAPAPQPGPAPAPAPTPTPTLPAGEEANFRFLISDDVNAIDNFASVNVTISKIGVHSSGESGNWTEFTPDITEVDLKPLVGENALEIWSGNLTAGEYNKVFIYVSDIHGILTEDLGGEEADIKLPSNKLQISKPFTISDSVVDFVYDITVVKAGKSGKYVLKPQIAESGAEQNFNELELKAGEGPEDAGESEGELELRLHGEPGPGAEVILLVTDDGTPVEEASVTMNGEEVGSTDANGQLVIILPDTPGEVEIEATLGDRSGEIGLDLEEQEETEQLLQWFEGTINDLSEGEENSSPWMMTLEGVEGQVMVYVTELEGTPAVGARAEIEGILIDNIIEDARAEIEEEEEEEEEDGEEGEEEED